MKIFFLSFALIVLGAGGLRAQQVPDTAHTFSNPFPQASPGRGSLVWVDEAHHNFHTLGERYAPFGKVLRQDGYRVQPNTRAFTAERLAGCRILVIANALDSASAAGTWQLPNPSAFTAAEIQVLQTWVRNGGRLFLIADHMPMAGAAHDLALAFGFEFLNCFAMDNRRRGVERFFRANRMLHDNPITRGDRPEARVDTVVTFTGSAFKIPHGARPILSLEHYTLLSPEVAWQFDETTRFQDSRGYYQGAYMEVGQGKLVVFGEAAMFTAQLAGPNHNRVGFNQPAARQNNRLLLNIMHWLDE